MGQLLSSEADLSEARDAIGSLLYNAMIECGAVPDLCIAHPLLLSNRDEILDSRALLQEQLRQLQGNMGNRAPTYLRDLIGRLSTFSDEPRLAGLVAAVVTMVVEMAYVSSRQSSGANARSAGSSSCQQRVAELQAVMEEYLKRCRINLGDHSKLTQDTLRLEAQLSLTLTQLKTYLLGQGCDSRSLKQWASGAAFHTQMLVHLAGLEGQPEPLPARAALEQYQEDLAQIIPVYRRYKASTVCVVKCRGGLLGSCDPSGEEEGSMTGLTVTDRETGECVTIPLSVMERQTGRGVQVPVPENLPGPVYSSANLDLITSDQYAQAYLDHLFSAKGPVADLQNYFTEARANLSTLRTGPRSACMDRTGARNSMIQNDGTEAKNATQGTDGGQTVDRSEGRDGGETEGRTERRGRRGETERCERRGESLKLSIVETEASENLPCSSNT